MLIFSFLEEVDHPRPMTEVSEVSFSWGGRSRRSRRRSRPSRVQSRGRGRGRGNRGRCNPRTEFSETRMVHLEVQNIITPLTCKKCFVTCLKTKTKIMSTNISFIHILHFYIVFSYQ